MGQASTKKMLKRDDGAMKDIKKKTKLNNEQRKEMCFYVESRKGKKRVTTLLSPYSL